MARMPVNFRIPFSIYFHLAYSGDISRKIQIVLKNFSKFTCFHILRYKIFDVIEITIDKEKLVATY